MVEGFLAAEGLGVAAGCFVALLLAGLRPLLTVSRIEETAPFEKLVSGAMLCLIMRPAGMVSL